MKGIDGVWSVEIYSYHGWERIATAFFDDGVYRAGSANHYTLGTYSLKGRSLSLKGKAKQWGEVRFVHGNDEAVTSVAAVGKLKKDGTITATFKEGSGFDLGVRFTRLGDL